jgi:transposase InsO family protein
MRSAGLVGCHRRRRWRRWRPGLTRRDPKATPAPDLCHRQFSPPQLNRLWHADYTELPTDQGTLYLVAVVDGCSRRAVGHAMGEHADAALAVSAVELAISRREVDPDQDQGLIHHSDQGSQGGFNRSLQHPNREGVVLWRREGRVRPIERCVLGCGHLGGPRSAGGRTSSGSGARSPRVVQRGRCRRMRRVSPGGDAVVP